MSMIPKGSLVTVKTTNGGEIEGLLDEDHFQAFDLVLCASAPYWADWTGFGRAFVIEGWRLASVEVVQRPDLTEVER